MTEKKAIGIDLGSSKCCVGVVRNGKVEIIENERGNKTTPSYVAFTDIERLIGEDAKDQLALNPANTVFGVKRMIGRKYDNPSLQKDVKNWPFKVTEDRGKPLVKVKYCEEERFLCPEQISAMMLTKMKRIAEQHLGCAVDEAVISVPAYFNNAQRQATKLAGKIAGLKVLALINEPTAAAIAYGDGKQGLDENVMLFDFGGGKLDISIIYFINGEIEVQNSFGNTSLGGCDFDRCLVEHFIKVFQQKHGEDISGDNKALERLRLSCEKVKHTLSLLPSGKIQVDCLSHDIDFEAPITREAFIKLWSNNVIDKLIPAINRSLCESHCNFDCIDQHLDRIDKVVLIGGSTRVPFVQEVLRDVLKKELDKSVNLDEAVAYGAAIHAAMLSGENSVQEVIFRDVSPHNFWFEYDDYGNKQHELFSYGSQIPAEKSYTMASDMHFISSFLIYENVYDCRAKVERSFLAKFYLRDCIGGEKVESVKYYIDTSGIFNVELGNDGFFKRMITNSDSHNVYYFDQLIAEEKDFQRHEEEERERLDAMNNLESYCFRQKLVVEAMDVDSAMETHRITFNELCKDTIDWLDSNPLSSRKECEHKNSELKKIIYLLQPDSDISQPIKKKKKLDHSLEKSVKELNSETFQSNESEDGFESGCGCTVL